jgi:hypothetical protein
MYLQQVDVAEAFTRIPIDDESIYAHTAQYDDYDGSLDYVDPSVLLQFNERTGLYVHHGSSPWVGDVEELPQNVDRSTELVNNIELLPNMINNPTSVADLHTTRGLRYRSPRALLAAMDNDTLRYHEAMCQADWDEFRKAASLEIKTLEKMGTWKEVPRSSVPKNKKVLGGTWVFKRKRTPEGTITKYKARYCVRGDQQVAGVDYFESYAPVCMWYTIRMMFILSIIYGWQSCQVDYTQMLLHKLFLKSLFIWRYPKVSLEMIT